MVQFAAVLNEKKAKIRELKQQAEDLQRRIKDADADVRTLSPSLSDASTWHCAQCIGIPEPVRIDLPVDQGT